MEAARAMIFDQNLSMFFWAEASNTTIYIQNRCPHSYLDNKTPKETFFGKKPDISHLRIFGCPLYVHVPKEKRTKLEPSRRKGILIGFNETVKGYKVYIPGNK